MFSIQIIVFSLWILSVQLILSHTIVTPEQNQAFTQKQAVILFTTEHRVTQSLFFVNNQQFKIATVLLCIFCGEF